MKNEGLADVERLSLGLEQSLESCLGGNGVVITDLDDVGLEPVVYTRRG